MPVILKNEWKSGWKSLLIWALSVGGMGLICIILYKGMEDSIETMRDNSHTRILSREEFEALFEDAFELQLEETTLVPVNLQSWMDLTSTPEDIQKDIIDKMEYDLNGGDKTGFNPYIKEGQICFDHRWLLLIGKKEN